jgi:hypothetical protein
MKQSVVLAIIAVLGSTALQGCADTSSNTHRNDAYYSGKPDTVREAEQVDGRAGARRSAPPAGAPASPVQ